MLRSTRLFQRIFAQISKDRRRIVLLSCRSVCESKHSHINNIQSHPGCWEYFTSKTLRNRALCTSKFPEILCWKCNCRYPVNAHGTTQFFCPSCYVVQEPQDRTHFEIMQCEQTFDMDTKQLTNVYRSLQSQLHPDKFSLKSETEQSYSNLQSSIVNEAYHTLLRPLSRGLYLLKILGLSIEEGSTGSDIEFLSNIMEMNETLESGSETALNKLKFDIKGNLERCVLKVSDAFQNNNIEEAKEILSKMKYYDNIYEQIKEKLME